MNSKLMNNRPSMSLEQLQLSLAQQENALLRSQLARRMGRSPSRVMPRVASEGLFDIFKPKIKEAKEKEKSIDQRLAELYQRVKNHRPSDKTMPATGLLALLKNGQHFKQTIADLKSAIEAEEEFLRLQLKVNEQLCHIWSKLSKDGDLLSFYREQSRLQSSIQPITPKGFKQKLAPSTRGMHKNAKYVFFHNSIETVCVETPFADFHLRAINRSHEPDQDMLDEPFFHEFDFPHNQVYFTTGPLNQFQGDYESRSDESLHSEILDLIEFAEKATLDSYSYLDLHRESADFSEAASISSNERMSEALRNKLNNDEYVIEEFFTYGYGILEDIYQGHLIDGIYSTEFMVEHLAIAFLQT